MCSLAWLVALIAFRLCSAKGHPAEKNIGNLQKEKCAAGLQQLITLSRRDRSEKCHEVFCNFATGNFGKDELAQCKSNALTHVTLRLRKRGMTKAQQWKTDFH